jgi:hypothetical protein
MTKQQIAQNSVKQLITAENKSLELKNIINSINGLKYEKTSQNISTEDRISIINEIKIGVANFYGSSPTLKKSFGIDAFNSSVSEIEEIIKNNSNNN